MYLSNVKTKSWLSSRGMILEYTCIKLCVSVIHLKSAKRITHKVYGHNTYQVNMVLLIHTESQNWYLSHLYFKIVSIDEQQTLYNLQQVFNIV